MIYPLPDPAEDIVGKVQQQFELIMNMEIVFFIGFGNLVFDRERLQGFPVFII
jgi:hypothetical protein